MTNWKELGEVPDSEDEDGFDSQDAEEAGLQPTATPITDTNDEHQGDVWDFPDSEDEEARPQQSKLFAQPPRPAASRYLDSSPLPLASTDRVVDTLDPVRRNASKKDTPSPKEGGHEPSFKDEVSTSYVRITAPVASQFTGGDYSLQASEPSPVKKKVATTLDRESGRHAEEQEARQTAVRYERSLRPRKPIQEHPYLLENAQYSSFLKEHGVKPLRMAIEAEQRRREETCQDNDFEQPSQEDELPEVSDESQPKDVANFLEKRDTLDFPSSSPPRPSPLHNRAAIGSFPSSQDNTDNTSIWDQALPDLDQLLNSFSRPSIPDSTKRKAPRLHPAPRKRSRQDFIHSDAQEPDAATRTRLSSPNPFGSPIPKLRRNTHSVPYTAVDQLKPLASPLEQLIPSPKSSDPVIDIAFEGEDDAQGGDVPQGDQESDSDQELVTTISRSIRGVLPASWLRLDQQLGRVKAKGDFNHAQRHRIPEREMRRGVAQPRLAVVPGTATTRLLLEESDEEVPPTYQKTTDDVFHNQTKLLLEVLPDNELLEEISSDDGGSVIEEDHIDRMIPGKQRQLRLFESFQRNGKRTVPSNSPSKHAPRQKTSKQPKITNLFHNSSNTVSATGPRAKKRSRRTQMERMPNEVQEKRARGMKALLPCPPRIGILDIVEPDAPRFLKIAARTAKTRDNQGRSSPRQKSIKLASRQDYVDAVSMLNEWKSGSIQQRTSVSAASQACQRHRQQTQPLTKGSGIPIVRAGPLIIPRDAPRTLVNHVSKASPVGLSDSSFKFTVKHQAPFVRILRRAHSNSPRPAQLEMDETEQTSGFTFNSGKRVLDRLFRKRGQGLSVASSVGGLEAEFAIQTSANAPVDEEWEKWQNVSNGGEEPLIPRQQEEPSIFKQREELSKTCRFRKRTKPYRIDVEAPQYTHADDPLPVQYCPVSESSELQVEGKKLQGLGPYGTRYTHHFEIFPLDPHVYFHESTLLGSGVIEACMSDNLYLKLLDPRPRLSFNLGDQILRWGPWNDQVSSEFGIVIDFIAEQLESDAEDDGLLHVSTAIDAASFMFRYVKDSLSLTTGATASPFVARLQESLRGFIDRMSPRVNKLSQHAKCDLVLICDRLLLVSFLGLRLCQGEPSLKGEQFLMEELLKVIARLAISPLLQLGVNRVKKTYEELNRSSYRERGLRADASIIHSWTLLMKVLGHAQLPRASFWDLIQIAMEFPQALFKVDARDYEQVWETMFTLLPLVEFNDSGIVIASKRHHTPSDGWTIPQKLLRRVFQLYQENERQAPSFNNYCRALVGRCHYLVQQWGWRRSAPVIGVIFDFFGSQSLANLRNEEVYKSPRFLEELARQPSLNIEPEDRCFHIFLKLLALSIRKLRDAGSDKDIRNLVARTIPNHNRQYLKEQNIHQRDLAALRNHHDLIGTLFWASPPDLRPAVLLIERLVSPASSHKEACLINIRAWNQLARFVASGEAATPFRPFSQWRNRFFQQMLQQFDTVAADIHQQLLALSKDVSKSVNRDMVEAMISMNKAAVVEVLHLSAMASLDVMRHAPDLGSASFCLNASQLQQVFRYFTVAPPELDWTVLRVTLATLDSFLVKVEELKDKEESQESESQILNSALADDALQAVDHNLSRSYFLMARGILSARSEDSNLSIAVTSDRNWCVEQVIKLSARMGKRFVKDGLIRLSDMFKQGKYGLFGGLPHTLSLGQRRLLVLFLSTLLKHGLDDFPDVGFSLCEVWALSLVKPREYLEYENQLAEQLCRHGKAFIPDAVVGLSIRPEYNGNRDLFQVAISWMRMSIRDAGPSLKKILATEHAKTLKRVMEQIQGDLKVVSQRHADQHDDYVIFVRDIISLIRAHGSDLCAVDEFFYQISKEYSPSVQDPQLQVAGMVSYGVRLQEGDTKVAHQLFFLLFNNFKFALASGRLQDDVDMMRKGIKHQSILGFVLGKMLPAIVRASFVNSAAFPLMDVYVEVLRQLLAGSAVAHELGKEDVPHLAVTLRAIIEGMGKMSGSNERLLLGAQAHVLRQALAILNLLWPSLHVLSCVLSCGPHLQAPGWTEVTTALEHLRAFAATARAYLSDMPVTGDGSMDAGLLFGGLRRLQGQALHFDSHVEAFTDSIVQDITKNWVVATDRISIPTPSKARGAAEERGGAEQPDWRAEDMAADVCGRVQEWCWWWGRFAGAPSRTGQHLQF